MESKRGKAGGIGLPVRSLRGAVILKVEDTAPHQFVFYTNFQKSEQEILIAVVVKIDQTEGVAILCVEILKRLRRGVFEPDRWNEMAADIFNIKTRPTWK